VKAKFETPSAFNAAPGTRPVHIRRVHASRRQVRHTTEKYLVDQVRTLCGKWVPRCEALRIDRDDRYFRVPSDVACSACIEAVPS